jgi:hypothetical protein
MKWYKSIGSRSTRVAFFSGVAFVCTIGVSIWQLAFPQEARAQGCCRCVTCATNQTCYNVGCSGGCQGSSNCLGP